MSMSAPSWALASPMPSRKHQRLVVLLAEHPRLFVELVRSCSGLDVPGTLELGPDTVRLPTTDRTSDGAVVVRRDEATGDHREAFVLEVQLREDAQKRLAWPIYVVGTAERLRCPVTLVVVTPSERVARWAAQPIDLGRGRMVLEPWVIGPRRIATEMSLDDARARPDRLALSVIVHGDRRGSLQLSRVAMQVARELLASGDRRSIVLADLIVDSVRADVRRKVQADMEATSGWGRTLWFSEIGKAVADGWAEGRARGRAEGRVEGRAEGRVEGRAEGLSRGLSRGKAEGLSRGLAKGKAEGLSRGLAKGKAEGLSRGLAKGKAEGLAKALRVVLRSRRLGATAEHRARVDACGDPRRLEHWLRRALVADHAAEIFEDEDAGPSARSLTRRFGDEK
jgi:hypothetical protein